MMTFVALKRYPQVIGRVVRAGEQVSEVKFKAEPWCHFAYYSNEDLVKVEDDETGMPAKSSGVDVESATPATRIDYKANRIKVLVEGNPRSPTAKAYTKWATMKEYMATHPNASIKEVSDKTLYKIGDFRWDLERGNVAVEKRE